MYGGYAGKILRVDLSTGNMSDIPTSDYAPDLIGGSGVAYRILWDETNENTDEWSPENALIFASGPLSSTGVPTAARTHVVGFAPQGYPEPWACWSSFGGDFGSKLKWAGYDAIVLVGKAESPKYLYLNGDGAELVDADFVWGMTTYVAQKTLAARHGEEVAIACIGPAGENRVRIATIQARTENAAGQGGFGAVMGDKKLKAVVVKPGSHRVPVANPEKLIEEVVKVSREICPPAIANPPLVKDCERYTIRRSSCGYSACTGGNVYPGLSPTVIDCPPHYYSNVPRKYTGEGTVSGEQI